MTVTLKLPRDHKAVIDELGRTDEKLAEYRRFIARHEELKKEILSWVETASPEWEGTIDGASYAVLVTAKQNQRTIKSIKVAAKALGKLFWNYCTVPLKVLDALLPADQVEKLVEVERTGRRTVTIMARVAEMKRAA